MSFSKFQNTQKKNIEALLRTHIQKRSISNFIFVGSKHSMMQAMFLSAAQPFYRSADVMELNAIDKAIYVTFITKHFDNHNRKVKSEDVVNVCDLFK